MSDYFTLLGAIVGTALICVILLGIFTFGYHIYEVLQDIKERITGY